ncbi:nitroreductase [Iamia sp. SCSIO 61187]|uniref:nitroreductase family protein n=1 Tax=Iamia sp. SCSIO 61187 TaxID=2722752 RepID=UPI001C6399DF|nr:nitroreductase family protein [Iamia sp. SCSIO 61187]QYG91934.1 nitroreductase [Iamia sp. SCSIO 61187]
MDVFEAMSTTRAMRRLDTSKEVSDADVLTMVTYATKAATGGNSQPVRWMVVRDPDKRAALGAVYGECWRMVRPMYASREDEPAVARMLASADHLGDHMGDAPVIILPCSKGQEGQVESSIFPGVQNLFLAGRALGLGTTLTTVHRFKEDEVRTVLDIPADVNTWAMIPVGYPTGRWGEPKRRPVEDVTYWDTWKNPPPTA